MIHRHGRISVGAPLCLALAAGLGGCTEKVPQGQVVAVVDGQEVTRRELAVEPEAAGLPQGSEARAALSALLGGVVDRKLAAAEARRLKLDGTPEFVAQSKRLEEVMLSRTLFDRWAAETGMPGKQAIADYIARNPHRFDGRKLFLVDRIQTDAANEVERGLAPLETNDAVAAYLKARSQPFGRENVVLDSASLPPELYRQLIAAAKGYPLAMVQNGRLVVLATIETRDAPLPQGERQNAAITALKQVTVRERLAALRAKAKVAYQPGYKPPTNGSSAGAVPPRKPS